MPANFTKEPDVIDFTEAYKRDKKYDSWDKQFGIKQDERTRFYIRKQLSCSYQQLLLNYVDFMNLALIPENINIKKGAAKIYIGGNPIYTYSFLDFGMLPLGILPIGIYTEEDRLYNAMIEYAKSRGIQNIYQLPVVDFFTGYWRTSTGRLDAWVTREDMARLLGVSPEEAHTAVFMRQFLLDTMKK